jgi:hypothetical protein
MPTRGACVVACLMPNWLKGDNVMCSILPRTWFRRLRRQGQQQVPTTQANPSAGFPACPRHRRSQCQRLCLPVRLLRCPTLCHRPRCTRVLSGLRWSQAEHWSRRSFRRLAFWLIRAASRPPLLYGGGTASWCHGQAELVCDAGGRAATACLSTTWAGAIWASTADHAGRSSSQLPCLRLILYWESRG